MEPISEVNQPSSGEVIRVTSHWLARVFLRADDSISLIRSPLSLRTSKSPDLKLASCSSCSGWGIGSIKWLKIVGEKGQLKLITTIPRQVDDLRLALRRELMDDCLREARSFHADWQKFLDAADYLWNDEFLGWCSDHKPPGLIAPDICGSLGIVKQIKEQFASMTTKASLSQEREVHNEKFREQEICSMRYEALERAKAFLDAWSGFIQQDRYLACCDLSVWDEENPEPTLEVPGRAGELGIITEIIKEFQGFVAPAAVRRRQVRQHNEEFLVTEEQLATRILADFKLTPSQIRAVILNEDNNLIQAGAGTGKTTTVVARVAYIVRRQLAHVDSILVLAFNKKAVEELRIRLKKAGLDHVRVETFHAYGLNVVRQSGSNVGLLPEAEYGRIRFLIQQILENLISQEESFRNTYTDFMLFWRYVVEPPHKFATRKDFEDHVVNGDLNALSGDRMRSREEVLVANFLSAHGIRFEYEKLYQPKSGKLTYHYKPDFYLTDYDVYLEHFALDREGNGPDFMGGAEYAEQAKRKRQAHLNFGTTLLESHSWHLHLPNRFETLSTILTTAGIKLVRQDEQSLLDHLNKRDGNGASNFAQFIAEFNSLMKNARLTPADLLSRATTSQQGPRCEKFLEIQGRAFAEYSEYCGKRHQIDYDDMIFLASKELEIGATHEKWDHILVDEFQDCSRGRVSLLKELRCRERLARLYCVGDDWQSIYRFAGSDVTCMTDFDNIFGETRHAMLDKTFRYGSPISVTSQRFIKRNPEQSQKSIAPSEATQTEPIEILFESRDQDGVHHILTELAKIDTSNPPSVLLLARYNYHLTSERVADYQAEFGQSLSINNLSIHRAKGKEADYVIVDKVLRGNHGFPNEREDDPLLNLVKGQGDTYQYGEERRLFYVALTRARKKVFVVSQNGEESSFVRELLEYGAPHVVRTGRSLEAEAKCVLCKEGILLPRTRGSKGALFFGCSSHPLCVYTEQPCSKCGRGVVKREGAGRTKCSVCAAEGEVCPRCKKGLLILKSNKRQGTKFWGCSLFGAEDIECRFTRNVD